MDACFGSSPFSLRSDPSATGFQTPSSLLDGEQDWKLTVLAVCQNRTPSSLLDGEQDWKLTVLACCHSHQSPSPSSKLDGVASFSVLSVPCSRQSPSPSSKLEGVKTIGQHGSRHVTKPLPADGPKNCCQHRLFVRRVKPTPSARVPLAACPPVSPPHGQQAARGTRWDHFHAGRASMISRFFIDRHGCHWRLARQCLPHTGSKLPVAPVGITSTRAEHP